MVVVWRRRQAKWEDARCVRVKNRLFELLLIGFRRLIVSRKQFRVSRCCGIHSLWMWTSYFELFGKINRKAIANSLWLIKSSVFVIYGETSGIFGNFQKWNWLPNFRLGYGKWNSSRYIPCDTQFELQFSIIQNKVLKLNELHVTLWPALNHRTKLNANC